VNPADKATVGRTPLEVTRLSVGTVPIGGLYQTVSDEQAQATLESAWSAGIRFFDTAPVYGMGLAERRLGSFLKGKPRDEVVVATKVGRLLLKDPSSDLHLDLDAVALFKGAPDLVPVFDFSYDGALRSLEESLGRLGLDRVGIVHIHDPDDYHDVALEGAFRALERLRDEGMISAVGAGMHQAEMLARFAREAVFDCFLVAGRYSLLDQGALTELLPTCLDRGISLIAGGVFNSGILADPDHAATFEYAPAPPELVRRAQHMRDVCAQFEVALPAAAIQFPLAHPAVASVLTGVRSPRELEENAAAFAHPIPDALWQALREEGLLADGVPVPVVAQQQREG
jgi:D-threo-aldose 1-dehydrogenase